MKQQKEDITKRFDTLQGQTRTPSTYELVRKYIQESVTKATENNDVADISILNNCNRIVINLMNENELDKNQYTNLINDIYKYSYKPFFRPSENSTNDLKAALEKTGNQVTLDALNKKLT